MFIVFREQHIKIIIRKIQSVIGISRRARSIDSQDAHRLGFVAPSEGIVNPTNLDSITTTSLVGTERLHHLSKGLDPMISTSGHQALKVFKTLIQKRHFELTEWNELSQRDQNHFSRRAVNDILSKTLDINVSYQCFQGEVKFIKRRMQEIFGASNPALIRVAQALDRSDVEKADESLAELQSQSELTVSTIAEVIYLRSCLAKSRVDYEQAHFLLSRAVQLVPNDIFYLFKMAQFEYFLCLFESAIDRFEKILNLDLEKNNTHTEISTTVWNELGLAWQASEEYHKAVSYFEQTLAADIKRYGNKHPHVLKSWINLGFIWYEMQEFERCKVYLKKAYDADNELKYLTEPEVLLLWNNLAAAFHHTGMHDDAIDLFDRVLMIIVAQYGDSHPNALTLWNNLGTAWYEKADYQRSIDYFEKVLAIVVKYHGEQDLKAAKAWSHLGTARNANAQFDLSVDLHQKALTLRLKELGAKHPESAVSWNELGVSWWRAENDEKKSIECLNRSLTALQFWGDQYQSDMKIVKDNLQYLRALLIAKAKKEQADMKNGESR